MIPVCWRRAEAAPPKHKQRSRQHTAGYRPSQAPAPGGQGDAAHQQMGQDNEVECPHRGERIERAPDEEDRREDERLRVGDAWMPAIMGGIPEWLLPGA